MNGRDYERPAAWNRQRRSCGVPDPKDVRIARSSRGSARGQGTRTAATIERCKHFVVCATVLRSAWLVGPRSTSAAMPSTRSLVRFHRSARVAPATGGQTPECPDRGAGTVDARARACATTTTRVRGLHTYVCGLHTRAWGYTRARDEVSARTPVVGGPRRARRPARPSPPTQRDPSG